MTSTIFDRVVDHLRSACAGHPDDSDARLLARFRDSRDPLAFEKLVEKYSPLVWGVCRRGVARPSDGEDAFQATFLSLVRQIDRLDIDRPLGPWLYAVAWRVARKTRTRSRGEAGLPEAEPAENAPGTTTQLMSREALRVIDEEIQRLPEPLREPLILCCLEGLGRDEAAVSIGCTPLAVKSRLERARGVLRERLSRRGIDLPVAFVLLHLTDLPAGAALRQLVVQILGKSVSPSIQQLSIGPSLVTGKLVTTCVAWAMVGMLTVGGVWALSAQRGPQRRDGEKGKPAETPVVLKDRFGDPLPEGAVRRFGTTRFHPGQFGPSVLFTKDSKHLLTLSDHSQIGIFDTTTGRKKGGIPAWLSSSFASTSSNSFAVSPDGKVIATGEKNVRLWDLETSTPIRELDTEYFSQVAFSPDGTTLVVVSGFFDAFLFDVKSGQRLRRWKLLDNKDFTAQLRQVAFTPDGKSLAVLIEPDGGLVDLGLKERKPSVLHFFDAGTGEKTVSVGVRPPTYGAPPRFQVLPKSNRIAYEGVGTEPISFLDLKTVTEAKPLRPSESARRPSFSADETRVAFHTPGSDEAVVVETESGKEVLRLKIPGITHCGLSPDGKTLAVQYGYGQLRVWDVESGKERIDRTDEPHLDCELSLSPDGRTLVGQETWSDRTLRWDLRSGSVRVESPPADREPESDPISERLIEDRDPERRAAFRYRVVDGNGSVEIYRRHGKHPASREGEPMNPTINSAEVHRREGKHPLHRIFEHVSELRSSPDGEAMALTDISGKRLWLWNPERQKEPTVVELAEPLHYWAFSHDNRSLVVHSEAMLTRGNTDPLVLLDAQSGKVLRKFATDRAFRHLLLTPDDRYLIAGGDFNNGTTAVFDMKTGKQVNHLIDPSLTLASDESVECPEYDKRLATLPRISNLLFSSGGKLLAVVTKVGSEYRLCVWETLTWTPVRSFPAYSGTWPRSLVFSQDGRSLFVSYQDSTILEWGLDAPRTGRTAEPDGERLERLWERLAETADRAYPAMWKLADHPEASLPLLQRGVPPVERPDPQTVDRLVDQLDSDLFRQREAAAKQLLGLGVSVLPTLESRLQKGDSGERKNRLEQLLGEIGKAPSSPDESRSLRALSVLEWIGGKEARELIDALAKGDEAARLTRAAREAQQRLK
jgi:RNA polymerase sigma factor (sigma-70 family)